MLLPLPWELLPQQEQIATDSRPPALSSVALLRLPPRVVVLPVHVQLAYLLPLDHSANGRRCFLRRQCQRCQSKQVRMLSVRPGHVTEPRV